MLTIYLSSTLDDLLAYRSKIKEFLGGLSYLIKESYDAATGNVRESCLEDVDACDFYVGIFAFRYGWIPLVNNLAKQSITEIEYRRAVERGKTCLIFLLDRDRHPWLEKYDDRIQDPDNAGKRIRELRELVGEHRPALFTTPEDLATKVLRAVQMEVEKRSRREEEEQRARARENLPSMHPEARHPHPRQLSYAALLLHVGGTDDAAASLIEAALQGPNRVRRMPFSPEDLPTPAALDTALATCRSVCMPSPR